MDTLAERPQVLDLMALVRTLMRPADRTAALAVLRGPWCGLTLEELHRVNSNPEAETSPEARRITDLVNTARAMVGRAELRYVVEHLWRAIGGPCFYPAERDQEDATTFFSMLGETEEGGVADLARLDAKLAKLYGAPEHGPDLHLMTIHKAKGLQFDNVVVTGLGSMFRPPEANLLAWTRLRIQGEERILMGAISATGQKDAVAAYLRRFLSERERNERRRVLYVAATRARSQLHLLGCVNAKGTAESGSLLKLLWPEFAGIPAEAKRDETAESAEARIRRVKAGWTPPEPEASLVWTPRIGGAASESKPTFEWAGDTMRHVGTAVHNWLHWIAREGIGNWDEARVRESREAIALRLANLGVPPDELRAAAGRVEDALVNVLEDPRGRWILTRHAEDRREYAVSGFVDGKLYHAVVDCTFVAGDGVRWVIDFKTGYQEGGGVEHFLDEEQRRYAPQLGRYARLLAQGGTVRAGLYFPLMRAWRSWETGAVRKAT
jgi:ATP-dependent exoDNAse (exonuclease V) beta subunit